MFKKYKNIILAVVILVVVFLAYSFFFSGEDSSFSLLRTETVDVNSQNAVVGREFLTLLLELRSLELDESIFGDESFMSLQDFSQEVQPQPVGRDNPFLNIGADADVSGN